MTEGVNMYSSGQSNQIKEENLYKLLENISKQVKEAQPIPYGEMFSNKLMINQIIMSGLSYPIFEKMQTNISFTKDEWAEFLDLSVRTLDRYKLEQKRFKASQSEKIIGLIEVLERGTEVFGDLNLFKQWLKQSIPALANTKPIELLYTSYGKELVLAELTRIEHGVLA